MKYFFIANLRWVGRNSLSPAGSRVFSHPHVITRNANGEVVAYTLTRHPPVEGAAVKVAGTTVSGQSNDQFMLKRPLLLRKRDIEIEKLDNANNFIKKHGHKIQDVVRHKHHPVQGSSLQDSVD